MVKIELMRTEHLQSIYDDAALKPCLTVPVYGHKFGVVLNDIDPDTDDSHIAGVITGFTEGEIACVQMLIMKDEPTAGLYRDALVRASMHFTELSGCAYLLIPDAYLQGLRIPYTSKDLSPAADTMRQYAQVHAALDACAYTLIDSAAFFKKGGC